MLVTTSPVGKLLAFWTLLDHHFRPCQVCVCFSLSPQFLCYYLVWDPDIALCVASGLALTARFTQAHPTMYWLIFFCLFTLAFKGLVALTRTVTHTHRHTHRHTHTHTQHTRHTQKPYKMVEKGLDQVVNKYHQNTDSNNYIHTTETIHNVEKKDKLAKFYSGWWCPFPLHLCNVCWTYPDGICTSSPWHTLTLWTQGSC